MSKLCENVMHRAISVADILAENKVVMLQLGKVVIIWQAKGLLRKHFEFQGNIWDSFPKLM